MMDPPFIVRLPAKQTLMPLGHVSQWHNYVIY